MALASVEITDEARSRLEELRDDLYRRTGERVDRRELRERCIADASRDELIEAFRDDCEEHDEADDAH